jgi:glycerophosphoryl diester phosphodiesterase
MPRGLLVERYESWHPALALSLGCISLHCAAADVEPGMLAQLHASELCVMAYTVNDPEVAARLFDLGVDGLFTDALDEMLRAFPMWFDAGAVAPVANP